MRKPKLTKWWLSFYARVPLDRFEYHGPWWISGETDSCDIVCAAVQAKGESAAIEAIRRCYDRPVRPAILDLRFCNERPDDWTPYCDRFPRAKWMRWPWPERARRAKPRKERKR